MSHQPKVYRKHGGDEMVVASGGSVTVESGGTLDVQAGGTINLPAASVLIGDLEEQAQRYADVTIPNAAVLTLNATPVTLVAAPGAGKALIFAGAILYKAAGTAFANIAAGDDLAIKYTDASGAQVGQAEMTGFADQTTAQMRWVRPHTAASGVSDITPVANAALVAHMLTGEIDTGNSELKLRVFYRVVPTTL